MGTTGDGGEHGTVYGSGGGKYEVGEEKLEQLGASCFTAIATLNGNQSRTDDYESFIQDGMLNRTALQPAALSQP
ncbi:hypothetical protein ACP70R_030338 [Stipagrostis hirtigluma subsp. patula]